MNYSFHGNTLAITFPGDLLSTSVETLRTELSNLLDAPECKNRDWKKLHLDLTRAKMVDSAGLNLLVGLLRTAKSKGAAIGVEVGNKVVHRTLLFTRLDRHMEIAVLGE